VRGIGKAIIYQDEKLPGARQAAGVAVHGGSGVSFGVIEVLRALRPEESWSWCIGSTGYQRVPASSRARRRHCASLHALLRTDGFEKRYLALVRGKWSSAAKRIDVPLRTDTRVGGERTVACGSFRQTLGE